MAFLFVKSGIICPEPLPIPNVKEYLYRQKSDLYTTMRMSGFDGKVFELEMHLKRLKVEEEGGDEKQAIIGILEALHQKCREDLRITLIRSGDKSCFDLIYEKMPKIEIESCQVEIRIAKRTNVQEKNSQWVKDRKVLEDSKSAESNEIILCDECGNLYEGLSSNFFAIQSDGSLQTAPTDKVLMGTMMKRVLELWKDPAIGNANDNPVIFEHPKISEIRNWRGAFITSTSRLILPINKIILKDGDGSSIDIPLNEVVTKMRKKLENEMC